MSKARFSAVASWRLLVGYSTRSTAPVRTMSLRLALGFGPRASTMAGTAPAARRLRQAGHAGVAVEDGSGDEHVERALLPHLLDHVADVGAGDDLVARTERGLDGPAQRRRTADDEDPATDHGADAVWSVPMHCPTGGGDASFWVWTTETDSFCDEELERPRVARVTARSSVSVAGMVRPVADGLLVKEGTVLWTSSTWMFAIASSVHGTGSVEPDATVALAPVENFDVGVDVDSAARLQVAGQRVRPGQGDGGRVHACRQRDG